MVETSLSGSGEGPRGSRPGATRPLKFTDPTGFEPSPGTPPPTTVALQFDPAPPAEGNERTVIWSDGARMTATYEEGGVSFTYVGPEQVITASEAEPSIERIGLADIHGPELSQGQFGLAVGLELGLLPGGAMVDQVLTGVHAIPRGTHDASVGKAVGEIIGGFFLTVSGVTGEGLGVGMSGTLVGATAGVPMMIMSAELVALGVGNMAAGIAGLGQALHSGGSGK